MEPKNNKVFFYTTNKPVHVPGLLKQNPQLIVNRIKIKKLKILYSLCSLKFLKCNALFSNLRRYFFQQVA